MRAPVGYKLPAQHFVYRKYIASFSLLNFPRRIRFLLPSKLTYSFHLDSINWNESLICRKEKGNEYDPYDVAISRNNVAVGRVSQNICDQFGNFLSLPKTSTRIEKCIKNAL